VLHPHARGHRRRRHLDHLHRLLADHVGADDAVGAVLGDQLAEPLGAAVEDGPVEWAGTAAYAGVSFLAALLAVGLARAGRHAHAAGALLLSLGCLFIVGEELSWGQRVAGWETPAGLRGANVQDETTVHNVSGVDEAFRVALLVVGMYGSCAWLVGRRRAWRTEMLVVVPPLFLASLFVVPLAYYGVRLALLRSPSYAVAKFSELPELLVASGLLAVLVLSWRRLRAGRST